MEQNKPIVTLGQAYEAGWRINARCSHGKMRGMKNRPECHTCAELDLETLIWTRGEGFPLERLWSRLKCPNCWSRRVAVWFEQDANVKRTVKATPQ
jgi:Zn finger protein HypA/HybF involved in hydrogenase expression